MGVFKEATEPKVGKNTLVVHAEEGWLNQLHQGSHRFFEKIGHAAQARGQETLFVHEHDVLSLALRQSDCTHLMMNLKPFPGANMFHTQPCYIPGFWYLDPKGFYWNSSVLEKEFDPETIDALKAREFFYGVRGHKLGHNVSKWSQPPRGSVKLSTADVAVFVQDLEKYDKKVFHLTTEKIIHNASRAAKGKVYVKLHPLLRPEQVERVTEQCDSRSNVELVDASIHDLIAVSQIIVSQNSAVGFEALMQKKAVLTCAKCDYHHATLVCKTGRDLRENIAAAPEHFRSFDFEKYFYWFLAQNMLEPQKDNFEERAMRILYGE
ncbi:hypothetical protein ATO10_07877 [Actibacterium atlanticum]|uniref:Capsule polysaccharide biosynthesis protein n=1 Tax=Actibacterium atlanticum TaxID=1461693 RepID=A0A058ZM80_9RHOB|nr:hypothetical protein [Actibacterium atlanticum]KCV82292.1 hypothetical protein ATO10_07877 [Actibacterium atlanticum]